MSEFEYPVTRHPIIQEFVPVPLGAGPVPCLKGTGPDDCDGVLRVFLPSVIKETIEKGCPVVRCPKCGRDHGFGVSGSTLKYGAIIL